MHLKTSTQLALKFTLYVTGLLALLGVVINLLFFFQRWRAEEFKLAHDEPPVMIPQEEHIITTVPVSPTPNPAPTPPTEGEDTERGNDRHGGRKEQLKELLLEQPLPKTKKIVQTRTKMIPVRMPLRDNMTIVPLEQEAYESLLANTLGSNLSELDEERVLYRVLPQTHEIKIATVTHFVQTQVKLIRIFLIALFILGFFTYGIAHIFVRRSLSRLWDLSHFVKGLDIHQLDKRLPLSGPENDEIRQIGHTLNTTLDTIQQQTNALKDFVAFASHELKTPLMAMSATLDLAEKTKKYTTLLPTQRAQLKRINELFDHLLHITKREFGQIGQKQINVVPLVQEVINAVCAQFPEHAKDITMQLPTELILRTDPMVFRIIVQNLLINAAKYTPKGGRIVLELNEKQLSVQDTGRGIEPEYHEQIFTRFWKHPAGTIEGKDEGFGLGLYMVKLLVQKHGRKILLDSAPEKGSTFAILFTK